MHFNIRSTLTSEDMKRIFRLRYAIDSLNSQLKDQSKKQNKMPSNEGTYASVKSLLSRNYMHHVDLSETRKSPKG